MQVRSGKALKSISKPAAQHQRLLVADFLKSEINYVGPRLANNI